MKKTGLDQPGFFQTFAYLAAQDKSEKQLHQIERNIGEHARSQCLGESQGHLYGKPYGAEQVTYRSAEHHAQKADQKPAVPFVYEESADQCHKDIADYVTAARTKELAGTGGKIDKYRNSGKAKKDVNGNAQGS